MAILSHLTGPDSPLVSEEKFHPPDMVYLALFDRLYVHWSMATADKAYVAVAALVGAVASPFANRNKATTTRALVSAVLGLVGGVIAANALAWGLSVVERKQLW